MIHPDNLLLAYGLLWHASDPATDYAVPDFVPPYKTGCMARQALLSMGISMEQRKRGIELARSHLAIKHAEPDNAQRMVEYVEYVEQSSRAMFVARLQNASAEQVFKAQDVLGLLNDCDMLASREAQS